MAHPFSNITTPWKVTTSSGIQYYENCAWDAIAIHFTIHKVVEIESFCHWCNEKIHIRLEKSTFNHKHPKTTVIDLSKPVKAWWNDIIDTCSNHMNFF